MCKCQYIIVQKMENKNVQQQKLFKVTQHFRKEKGGQNLQQQKLFKVTQPKIPSPELILSTIVEII